MHLPKIAIACAVGILLASGVFAQGVTSTPPLEPFSTAPPSVNVGPTPAMPGVDPALTPVPLAPGPYNVGASVVPLIGPSSTVGLNVPGERAQTESLVLPPNQAKPIYSLTTDTLFYKLERAVPQPLIINNFTNLPVLSTDNVDLGFHEGPRVYFSYLTEEGDSFDLGYFGIYDWNSHTTVSGGSFRVPSQLGLTSTDFSAANAMDYGQEGNLNSLELNLSFGQPDGLVKYLVGIRYIRLQENLALTAANAFTPLLPQFPFGRTSTYSIAGQNELFGIQGGTHIRRRNRWFDTILDLKLGIYDNNAKQTTQLTDLGDTQLVRSFTASQPVPCWAAEGSLTAEYPLNKKWSLRGGYNVLWLANVARVTDQLDFTTTTNSAGMNVSGSQIQFRNGALMHGGHIGLEAQW